MANKKKEKVIDIQDPNQKKKEDIKKYLKDLGLSTIHTKNLFRFGVRHWITPLIIFLITIACFIVPPYIKNNSQTGQEAINKTGVLYADTALSHILSTDVKCKVNDSYKLECDEGYKFIESHKEFENEYGKKIYYDLYVNAPNEITALDENEHFKVSSFSDPGDNYIALYEETFIIRYVHRNDDTGSYYISKLYGFYNDLQGLNLHQKYDEINALSQEERSAKYTELAHEIIVKGYQAANVEASFIQLTSNLFSYLLLLAVAALLVKGNYLLNTKKGLKYTQCIKITIMMSTSALPIAIILNLLGFDLITLFGLILTCRALYVWLRYTASRKNIMWLNDLYEYSHDSRFLVGSSEEKK